MYEILPLFDDVKTRTQIKALAEREFGTKVTDLQSLGGGWFGLCWKTVGEDGVPRVLKAYRVAGMNRTQAEETELLAKHCPLPMPKTLFVHDPDEDFPLYAMGMSFVEGVVACSINPHSRSRRAREAFAEEVTDSLLKIHAAENDKFGFIGSASADSWLDFYLPLVDEVYRFVKDTPEGRALPKSVTGALERSYRNVGAFFQENVEKASLVHADLNVANIMVDLKTLKPTALIDPFGTMWGDREFELHQLRNLNGKPFFLYDTYLQKYKVSETLELKLSFYAIWNEIRCYMLSGKKADWIFPRMVKDLNKQMKRYDLR